MHFYFISSIVASLALAAADAAKPFDRLLQETLPTLPEKEQDASEGMMASPKSIVLDAPKALSSQYSLKLEGSNNDAKKKALKFQTSNGQKKIAPPPDLMTSLEPQDIKLKGDGDRRLQNKVSNLKDGTQGNLKGLRGSSNKADAGFMADVAAPILLANKLSNASGGDPNRRLQTANCIVLDDGSVGCIADGFPGNGFYTIFVDCPIESPTVFDCLGCAIFGSNGEPAPLTDPLCLDCALCFDSVAYDCSNLGEGNCVAQNCNGDCTPGGSNPVPSPTPVPVSPPSPTPGGGSEGGVSCQSDQNGDVFCVAEGYPATGFLTVFLDCPFETTNALQCGRCAIVPPDDTPLEIDLVNDEQCNSCTVCSDKAAYDCSNLDSGDCSVFDCAGTCSGPTTGEPSPTFPAPTPTAAQPTNPSPTFPAPTPTAAQPTEPSGGTPNPFPGGVSPPRATSSAPVTAKGAFVAATIGSMMFLGLF